MHHASEPIVVLSAQGIAVDVALHCCHVSLLQRGMRRGSVVRSGSCHQICHAVAHYAVDIYAAPARPRSLEVLHGEGLRIVALSHAAGEIDCSWAPVELVPFRLLIVVMLLRFMRAATCASMRQSLCEHPGICGEHVVPEFIIQYKPSANQVMTWLRHAPEKHPHGHAHSGTCTCWKCECGAEQCWRATLSAVHGKHGAGGKLLLPCCAARPGNPQEHQGGGSRKHTAEADCCL